MNAAPPEHVLDDDPLPHRRLLQVPALGGVVKARPEDFLVDEMPLYEPSGSGEHLYLFVQKRGMAHSEMIELLCRHFGVGEESIGFGGMKDKIAITRQLVSIHLPGKPDPSSLPADEDFVVLWAARHGNKLRRGHLAGNRFSIRIRGIEPSKVIAIRSSLRQLERDGIPDYYGAQRFGYRRNTHRLGRHLLTGNWSGLVDELVGTVSPFPEHQRPQRELAAAGRWKESLPHWARNDRAERLVVAALGRGRTPEQAIRELPPHTRSFWVSAFQSATFNRVLDRRIADGLFASIIEGDVAYKHQTRGQFVVTKEILAGEDLKARLDRFEISPSGPMHGSGMIEAGEPVATWEREATTSLGVPPELLSARSAHAEGTRRPLRVPVSNTEIESGVDEHGGYVRLAFDLPRGAYATVLLRELLGEGAAADEDPDTRG